MRALFVDLSNSTHSEIDLVRLPEVLAVRVPHFCLRTVAADEQTGTRRLDSKHGDRDGLCLLNHVAGWDRYAASCDYLLCHPAGAGCALDTPGGSLQFTIDMYLQPHGTVGEWVAERLRVRKSDPP